MCRGRVGVSVIHTLGQGFEIQILAVLSTLSATAGQQSLLETSIQLLVLI